MSYSARDCSVDRRVRVIDRYHCVGRLGFVCVVSEMTYTVSSGTLNPTILYYTTILGCVQQDASQNALVPVFEIVALVAKH